MAAPFELPALPYDDTFLAPVIGQQTVQLHHGKHHATYFAKLNPLVEGTDMADMSLEEVVRVSFGKADLKGCLLYTSPSPRDLSTSRMPSSA